jgi:hypothetical protein
MTRLIVLVFVSSALLARPVFAQQAAAPATGLQIEQIQSGFVVAPDVRFTDLNDRAATLAGVYGGWLTDRTLLIGGGAYWLANRADDFKMQYVGGLVRWTIGGDELRGPSGSIGIQFGGK